MDDQFWEAEEQEEWRPEEFIHKLKNIHIHINNQNSTNHSPSTPSNHQNNETNNLCPCSSVYLPVVISLVKQVSSLKANVDQLNHLLQSYNHHNQNKHNSTFYSKANNGLNDSINSDNDSKQSLSALTNHSATPGELGLSGSGSGSGQTNKSRMNEWMTMVNGVVGSEGDIKFSSPSPSSISSTASPTPTTISLNLSNNHIQSDSSPSEPFYSQNHLFQEFDRKNVHQGSGFNPQGQSEGLGLAFGLASLPGESSLSWGFSDSKCNHTTNMKNNNHISNMINEDQDGMADCSEDYELLSRLCTGSDAVAIAELNNYFYELGLNGINKHTFHTLKLQAQGLATNSNTNGSNNSNPDPNSSGLTESRLIRLALGILLTHGSVPVGKMGSLLHRAANDHTLPSALKERYGGLKKFLVSQPRFFLLSDDHPYNPHVTLAHHLTLINGAFNRHTTDKMIQNQTSVNNLPSLGPLSPSPSISSGKTSQSQDFKSDEDLTIDHSNRGHPTNNSGSYHIHSYGRSISTPLNAHVNRSIFPLKSNNPSPNTVNLSRGALAPSFSPLFDSPSYSPEIGLGSLVSSSENNSAGIMTVGSVLNSSSLFNLVQSHPSALKYENEAMTDIIALDCEMVGARADGLHSILARCSIVNYYGNPLYDVYVKPTEIVTDYRTHVSGIHPHNLESQNGAIDFTQCREHVRLLIKNRIIVGHSLASDFQALLLSPPPAHLIKDTAFSNKLCPNRPLSLKYLVQTYLTNWPNFQCGEHDSIEDAKAVLDLFKQNLF